MTTKVVSLYNNIEIWQYKSSKRRILWCKKPILKLIKLKNNLLFIKKYLIAYLDGGMRSLVLILPKISGYKNL